MKPEAYEILLIALIGMSGSVLTGLIMYGTSVFNPYTSNFQFITAGLYGSLLFSILTYKGKKQQVFTMIGIFLFNLVIFSGRSVTIYMALRDFVSLAALFSAITIYYQFIHRYEKLKLFLRSFALSFIYGILAAAAGSFLYPVNTGILPPLQFIHFMAKYGILIGFGTGMAIDFYLQYKIPILRIFKVNPI
jgi:hypothetical protein